MVFLCGCENYNPNPEWCQTLINEDTESRYALMTEGIIRKYKFVKMKFKDVKPYTKCYVETVLLENKHLKNFCISFWKTDDHCLIPQNNQTLVECRFVKDDTDVYVRQSECQAEFSTDHYYANFLQTQAKCKSLLAFVINNTKKVLIVNTNSGKTAMSVCAKDDPFNYEVGVALAWARYCGHDTSYYEET